MRCGHAPASTADDLCDGCHGDDMAGRVDAESDEARDA